MPLNESLPLRPPKISLVNLATGAGLDVQFNPATLEETLGVNYARQVVPGLGYQVLQFINTNNFSWVVDLYYTAEPGPAALEQLQNARKWLHSACYPRAAGSVATGGAPRLLFVWPGILSLTCVVTALKGKFERFNVAAQPASYAVNLTFEEIRDARLLSDDVLRDGTQRSADGTVANVDLGEV